MNKNKLQSQLNCINYNTIEIYTSDPSELLRIKYDSYITIDILHSTEYNKIFVIKYNLNQKNKTKVFDTEKEVIDYICSMME